MSTITKSQVVATATATFIDISLPKNSKIKFLTFNSDQGYFYNFGFLTKLYGGVLTVENLNSPCFLVHDHYYATNIGVNDHYHTFNFNGTIIKDGKLTIYFIHNKGSNLTVGFTIGYEVINDGKY